jgi:hypothetical protein
MGSIQPPNKRLGFRRTPEDLWPRACCHSRERACEKIRIASFVMAGPDPVFQRRIAVLPAGRINHARLAGVANETAH